MKAIQIKYLPPTDTLGSRWKVWADGVGSMTAPVDMTIVPTLGGGYKETAPFNPEAQAEALASDFAETKWGLGILGIGTLPNGNYVALLSND